MRPRNEGILSRLRTRNRLPQQVTAESASAVVKQYLQPLLTREFVCHKQTLLSPRSPRTESQVSIRLKRELESAYATLGFLHKQLETVVQEKESVCLKITEFKESLARASVIGQCLEFGTRVKQRGREGENSVEKCFEKIRGEEIAVENDALSAQVETEHSFNNIRFYCFY
jgi:hypothetical protein